MGLAQTFGAWLREKRTEKGFTQEQLASRTGGLCTKSYVSQLEREYRTSSGAHLRPSLDLADALANALGQSRNEVRRMLGYHQDTDQITADEAADEFAYSLARFRLLSDDGKKIVKRQIKEIVDFVFATESSSGPSSRTQNKQAQVPVPPNYETGDIEPASQTVIFVSEEEKERIPKLGLGDLKKKLNPADHRDPKNTKDEK